MHNSASFYIYIFNIHSPNKSSSLFFWDLKLKYSGSLIKGRSFSELSRRLASVENSEIDGAVVKREVLKCRIGFYLYMYRCWKR